MVKDVKIYLYGLKKTCLGVLDRGDRDKDSETGFKEGGGIKMSIYSAFHIRDACSLSLLYFTYHRNLFRKRIRWRNLNQQWHVKQHRYRVQYSFQHTCSAWRTQDHRTLRHNHICQVLYYIHLHHHNFWVRNTFQNK